MFLCVKQFKTILTIVIPKIKGGEKFHSFYKYAEFFY